MPKLNTHWAQTDEMPKLNTHWAQTDEMQKKTKALSRQLNLDREEMVVALGLGADQSVADFEGTYKEATELWAKQAIKKLDGIADEMAPEEPIHQEARTVAFTEVFTGTGRKIHITAREGATPDTIASTYLALVQAIAILETNAGVKR